jgi:hypothetical protein
VLCHRSAGEDAVPELSCALQLVQILGTHFLDIFRHHLEGLEVQPRQSMMW